MQSELIFIEVGLAIFGGICTVLWWLIRQKISSQESQIETLWEKHDEDAKRLQDLELDIAKHHYLKTELDPKFEQLAAQFKTGMDSLGAKFDRLSEALIQKGVGQ